MRDFPNVRDEPTSYVPRIARNDEFETYQVIDCPECGNEAYQKKASGGVTNEACRRCKVGSRIFQRKVNYGEDWSDVREWVLDRDNHRCQDCGERAEELHIHHREKLIWFETTKEAHTPDNLVTLCPSCHEG